MSAQRINLERGRSASTAVHHPRRAARVRGRAIAIALAVLVSTCSTLATGEPVRAIVKTVEPDVLAGRVVSLSLNDGLRLDVDGDERRVVPADLVRMTLAPRDGERGRRDMAISLRDGDLLLGTIKKSADGAVSVETSDVGDIDVPLEAVGRIDTPRAMGSAQAEAVGWFDRDDQTREDRVLLTNGDVLHGFVTGVREDALSIDGALGEVEVAMRLVVSIRFAAQPRTAVSGPRCTVTFRDGGRVTVCSLNWDDDSMSARLCVGPTVHVAIDRVARLEFAGGRWEWLSDHVPISFEQTPMLSLAWELQENRNVLGQPMIVAGETYERGLGVHSRSSLIYDLGEAYSGLETWFGLDDDTGALADVDVMIRVDGQPRFRLEHVRRGTLHGPVRLDLKGAKRIELLVDFGVNGDIQDRFDWVEPAFIR